MDHFSVSQETEREWAIWGTGGGVGVFALRIFLFYVIGQFCNKHEVCIYICILFVRDRMVDLVCTMNVECFFCLFN